DFAKERAETKDKFDSRLSHLEDTFRQTSNDNQEKYESDLNNKNKHFLKVEKERKEKFDEDQDSFHSRITNALHDSNLQNKKELRSIQQEKDKELVNLRADYTKQSDEQKRTARGHYLNLEVTKDNEIANNQEN